MAYIYHPGVYANLNAAAAAAAGAGGHPEHTVRLSSDVAEAVTVTNAATGLAIERDPAALVRPVFKFTGVGHAIMYAAGWRIEGIEVDGSGTATDGIRRIAGASINVQLIDVVVHDVTRDAFEVGDNGDVQDCIAYNAGRGFKESGPGIVWDTCTAYDCTTGATGYGFDLFSGGTAYHCVADGCKTGFRLSAAATVYNSIATNNSDYGYWRIAAPLGVIESFGHGNGTNFHPAMPVGCSTDDPVYVDPVAHDYRTSYPGSPCRDFCLNVVGKGTDQYGQVRPNANPDAGIYEWHDTSAPVITHAPIADGQPACVAIVVQADIVDDVGVAVATLYYRAIGAVPWLNAAFVNVGGDSYEATIPGPAVLPPGIEYFIEASDAEPNTSYDPALAPAVVHDFTVVSSPPVIVHVPIPDGQPVGVPVLVSSEITDNVAVVSANLYYRTTGAVPWNVLPLLNVGGDIYEATIPGGAVAFPGVDYYLEATDGEPATTYDPALAPVVVHQFMAGVGMQIYVRVPTATDLQLDSTVGLQAGELLFGWTAGGGVPWSGRALHVAAPDHLYMELHTAAQPTNGDSVTNGTVTRTLVAAPVTMPAVLPAPLDNYVGAPAMGSAGVVDVIANSDGRHPATGLGLVADDYQPFQLPTAWGTCRVVEVAEGPPALTVGERVSFLGGSAKVFARSTYYYVLVEVTGTIAAGTVLRTNRGYTFVGAHRVPVANVSVAVVQVWSTPEYSVPNLNPGRYFWADALLRTDYALRLYSVDVGGVVAIAPGSELVDVDPGHAVPRWRGTILTASVFCAPPFATTRTYTVLPQPGYPRSQPYTLSDLEVYVGGAPSGGIVQVRAENWSRQWVAGTGVLTGDPSGRNVGLSSRHYPILGERIG